MSSAEDEPQVQPPFLGLIETTRDALIVFEASRRGLIPRITRRLAERERAAMICSGSVFVFDEGESGIKRWTDGKIWSPSRILSNFLVYRETDKRADRHNPLPVAPKSPPPSTTKPKPRKSPPTSAADGPPAHDFPPSSSSSQQRAVPDADDREPSLAHRAGLAGGPGAWPTAEPHRAGSSDGGDSLEMDFGEVASGAVAGIELGSPPNKTSQAELEDDAEATRAAARTSEKARERQLVGSLTTTYRFKEKGLVKKTISVCINGVAQHLVSYYSMEDALAGRLRSPSTVPELFALDISPDYLSSKHFRFPPKVEVGPDGVHRYRGEPDEPESPPLSAMSLTSSSSSTRAPTAKAKRDTEGGPARRGSKASSNGGHNVGGPSADVWQQSTPTSWSGRPGSPIRQAPRPTRPGGLQRRSSEQVEYPPSMASPRWNGNQQQLHDHQLQQQQHQHGYPVPGPSSHRRLSPVPMTASSSYHPPSTFQHEMQYGSSQSQMYAPPIYPDTVPSVLARPMDIRRQSLAGGMERLESSDGSAYGVSPSRSSFQSLRNSRNFHPYAPSNDGSNGAGETIQFTQPGRRGSEYNIHRRGSPPPPLAGLPAQPDRLSPPSQETPPLEPETDFAQYSYAPPYDQPATPLNGHPPSHHPHPYHHPQYQPPQDSTNYYQPIPSPSHQHLAPQSNGYPSQPQTQPAYAYPSAPPMYFDPNGRGPPQQAYDQYGRPAPTTQMDPYAFQQQHLQQQAVDDEQRRYASGMVAGGGQPTALGAAPTPQVKEERDDELDGYAWGYPQPQQ